MEQKHWQDWVTLLVGLWLIISPWALGAGMAEGAFGSLATWNFVLSGAAAAILAALVLFAFRQWEEWLDLIVGLWLVISPWILGFSDTPMLLWNALLCGAVIAVMSGWTAMDAGREGMV